MTVMAAEAAGGTEAVAARGAAARSSGARSPRPRKPVTRTPGGIAPAEPGPRGAPGPPGPAGEPESSRQRRDPQRSSQRRSGPSARKISRTNYQPVILMEFVAAILLTAATPIATKKDSQGLSPYAGADIVKLSAITLVYLLLAMISVGGRSWGRVAAWLGGLILLTDGLYEASNIAKDLQIFGGGGTSAPTAPPVTPPSGINPAPSGQTQFGVSGG